jgi:hypothetical protein
LDFRPLNGSTRDGRLWQFGLTSNREEVLLLPFPDNLKQIFFQLLPDENSPFDVVLIHKILLTEKSFVLCSHILMQKINFGQMVRGEQPIGRGSFRHISETTASHWQKPGKHLLKIAFFVSFFGHC